MWAPGEPAGRPSVPWWLLKLLCSRDRASEEEEAEEEERAGERASRKKWDEKTAPTMDGAI